MSGWTIAWLFWGGLFLLVEVPALFLTRNGSGTLSAHFWRWLKVSDPRPTPLVWILRAGVIAFCGWLALHLTLGWFTPTHPWPF